MAVTISIEGEAITTDLGIWQNGSVWLKNLVKSYRLEDITDYTSWPDYTLAEMVVKALGGKIIKATDRPQYVKDRVY